MSEKKLVGLEIADESISLEDQNLVGKASLNHVGKLGSVKLTIEGKFELLPLVNAGIDKLEALIPGDQSFFAAMAKEAVSKIKIKF